MCFPGVVSCFRMFFGTKNFEIFEDFLNFFGSMEINENQWKSMKINGNQWKSMKINGPKKIIKSSKIKNFQKFQNCSCRKTSGNNSQHLENTFPTIRTVPKYYSRYTKKLFFFKKMVILTNPGSLSLATLHMYVYY